MDVVPMGATRLGTSGQVGQQVGGGAPFAFGMSDGAVMQGVIGDMGP
jgi:hypothetical protein